MDAKFCPNCGNARTEGLSFCGRCGQSFGVALAPAPVAGQKGVGQAAATPPTALTTVLVRIGALTLALALGALWLTRPDSSQPSAAAPQATATPYVFAPAPVTVAPVTAAPVVQVPANYAALSARDWALVVKTPDSYIGKGYQVWACVTQFDAATGRDTFRGEAFHKKTDTWFSDGDNVLFTGQEAILAPIVRNDVISANVVVLGSHTYDTTLGGSTTVPLFRVSSVQVKGSCA